jgi:cation:H+ antiporter
MISTIGLLVTAALLIYGASEFFVNGVEWFGRKTSVAENAVGSILAAFGTALPESVVTLMAVAFGHGEAAKDIGVGAALGGPLVLSTIAYAVVGWTLWISRPHGRQLLAIDGARLSRDQGWFLIIFAAKFALGLVAFAIKPWLGIVFLAAYAMYFWSEMRHEDDASEPEALAPLKFRPHDKDPALGWAASQTLIALVVIFAASRLFVDQLEALGPWLGLSPTVVALLLSPVATELPEIMNAIIWVRQGKERLALANISGAMMIQATVPSALGLFFTPWLFDSALILAAAITMVSVVGLFLLLRRDALTGARLSIFGLLYAAFAIGLMTVGF